LDDTHDDSASTNVEAFRVIGRALAEPAVLTSADGVVVAVNAAASERMPAVGPGTDLRELVTDRPAWERFLDDVRSCDGTVVARLAFGPPLDVVSLVAAAALPVEGDAAGSVLLRVLSTSTRAPGDGDLEPAAELAGVLAGTERLVAEHARLEAVLDQTSAMIYVKDRAGRYITVNREFERVRRTTRSEVLGRTAADLIGPESAAQTDEEDERIWRSGGSATHYNTALVDGVERSYVTVKFRLPGPEDEPPLLAGIATDITDHARAESALREALEQLRVAQRVGQLGNWERDLLTESVQASDVLVELFGVSPGAGLPDFAARYHPDDVDVPAELSVRARAGGGRQRGCYRIVRPDGVVRWMETTVELVGDADAPRLVGITQDVTDRELAARARDDLEARLRQAERLESVGQLAGGIAHDFNNVLAVVLIQAELLLGELDDGDPLAEDLGRIRDAAQRAGALTRQLLEFSRSDGGATTVFDLGEVVSTVANLLGRTLGEHIALHVERGPDLWAAVADPTRAEQVILNLAVNARDAMPDGGTLTIRTTNQEIDEENAAVRPGLEPGRYVELSVSDTGVGMAADVRQRAFDPFFTTKPKGRGTGLGLASVYGIVSAARGHVEIYSELGIGTVIRVLLPAMAVAPETPEAAADVPPPGDGRRILVVEDDDLVRGLVMTALTRAGYDVSATASATEAVTMVDAGEPLDVLVTDVVLTELSGPRVADEVVRRHPQVAVLFMSGYPDGLLADRDLEHERRRFIGKPFTVDRLLREVAALCTLPRP
jgi:PAS domain S-box-containing protein